MTQSKINTWDERRGSNNPREEEIRSEAQRDLSRLIHSSPFRRLQSKTQVLGLGESDFYRTRLTHSMEVAQIGSGLLAKLKIKYKGKEEEQYLPDKDLMQAICLAHDIGHPPFGHGGEVALNYCMLNHGGFEGNGQTLRILSKLDKYTQEHGLDPTRRLLLGVLKYPVNYSALMGKKATSQPPAKEPNWLFKSSDFKPPKCYLDSERDIVEFALSPFTKEDRELFTSFKLGKTESDHKIASYKALDTTIMDLADEISYSLHDLEDAISLGMVTRAMWMEHFSGHEKLFTDCHGITFSGTCESVSDSLFGESYRRKECIGMLVHLMITSVELNVKDGAFECGMLKYNAVLPEAVEALRLKIFMLVKDKVIKHENVQLLEFKGQKLIVELFSVLASDPCRFLPTSTREVYERQSSLGQQEGMRVICDYVSGMTDDYATKLYEKILIPRKGSIFDHL
ncbi:anti-phage deoxyguanosine triphosphatase [Enterobacter quasiroggenkampii]|uniref:anti-phage deoxyguanosine triphosphatase n=1 Tax=Enterobacter quasiroggenkampii TaxID=2497436 RepID=UPI0020759ACF|nr:anti-phage deoxyguanosine triphosphatase [Enterobacter quasiroggenkampii]MCM7533106.1 deoxyguanosinetriphosphate triphosphohydrolase family protein [Enterobacter quasiroggenkampii]